MEFFYVRFTTLTILMIGCIIASLLAWRKTSDKIFLVCAGFHLVSLAFQWAAYLYSHYTGISNHFIVNLSLFPEFIFYGLIYLFSAENTPAKRVITYTGILLMVFTIYNMVFVQGFRTFNTYTRHAAAVAVIIYSLVYLYQLLKKDEVVYFKKEWMFWITTGILVSTLIPIFYYSLFDYIQQNKLDEGGIIFQYLTFTGSAFRYLMFMYGFLTASKWEQKKLLV